MAGRGELHRLLEFEHELAAVAETGERVGERLVAARGEQADVLAEGDGHAHDHGSESRDREPQRERVLRAERVVGEQRQAGDGECRRHHKYAPPFEAHGLRRRRLDPRSASKKQRRGRPQRGHQRRGGHAANGRLVQEVPVHDRARHEAGAHHHEGSPRAPAGHREHGDHEAEQQQVAHRVGEVDRDRLSSAPAAHDCAEDEVGPDRRRRQRAHEAVQPQALAELAHALAHQEHDRDVAGRVEREPERVGDARGWRLREVGVKDRVIGLAGSPRQQADPQHRPGEPFRPHRQRAREA